MLRVISIFLPTTDSLQGYSLPLFLGVFRNASSLRGYISPMTFALEVEKDNSPPKLGRNCWLWQCFSFIKNIYV